MRLSCKRGMQIAVYSAMFGRTQQGTLECPLHHRRAPSVGEVPSHSLSGGVDCQMIRGAAVPALLWFKLSLVIMSVFLGGLFITKLNQLARCRPVFVLK